MTLPELMILFLAFFEIGLFTFGGGYAMIPMIEEAVLRHGWLANTSFSLVDFIAVSESTPGPFAVNIATFIGMSEAGIPGAILATVGVVLPSFIVILLIARFFRAFSGHPIVKAVLSGIRPVVVGILFTVMLSLTVKAIFHSPLGPLAWSDFDWKALVIFAVIFGLSRLNKKIGPIILILFSAGLGILLYGLV